MSDFDRSSVTPSASSAGTSFATDKTSFSTDNSPFNADFTASEARAPHAVQFDQGDWLQPPAPGPVTTAAADPWL